MKIPSWFFLTLVFLQLPVACGSGNPESSPKQEDLVVSDQFRDYWFKGTAEISGYRLEQARYGEMRSGEAVLVFVTEPFSKSKGVKLDNAEIAGSDRVDVLKLNFTRNFITGIYPYSVMSSIFTPVSTDRYNPSLKSVSTCQEWCGQTFTQLNREANGYDVKEFSYFESEGDRQFQLKDVLLEDELWTMLRIAPGQIPTGLVSLLPSGQFLRFSHEEIVPREANISIQNRGDMNQLKVMYPYNGRSLEINYSPEFPYTIESWADSYKDGWGEKAQVLTTRGTLMGRINSPYWTENANSDTTLRHQLGLAPQ